MQKEVQACAPGHKTSHFASPPPEMLKGSAAPTSPWGGQGVKRQKYDIIPTSHALSNAEAKGEGLVSCAQLLLARYS